MDNRGLLIFLTTKEFDLKYSEAAVIVDARSFLNNLAKTNDLDETWNNLVDVVYANIKASFNITDEQFNEINEFIEFIEGEQDGD